MHNDADEAHPVLPEQECWQLLGSKRVGRVAFTVDALPAILPVGYQVIDWFVVCHTSVEPKLFQAMTNAVVAFEVDDVAAGGAPVWSVTAVGRALALNDQPVVDDLKSKWQPAAPEGARLLALRPDFISGQRFLTA